MHIPQKLLLNLERDNMCTSTYISNSIEGNPLSLPEVTNLLLDGRMPVNRSEQEARNYYTLLQSLLTFSKKRIDRDILLKIHTQLLSGVQDDIAGSIRNNRVVVGRYDSSGKLQVRHEPPTHSKKEIIQYIDNLMDWVRETDNPSVLQAGIFHHHFVFLHPFADGNGRTCRLATALILLNRGYLLNKYFVLDDYYDVDRQMYADKLHSADSGDKTEWLEYFTDGMVYSLRSAKARIEAGLTQEDIVFRPTKREQDVLVLFRKRKEMRSGDIALKLKISRQQAHNLLKSLVEKGHIIKKGSTKGSYYILA